MAKLLHCICMAQNKIKSLSLLFASHIYKSEDVQLLLIIHSFVFMGIK